MNPNVIRSVKFYSNIAAGVFWCYVLALQNVEFNSVHRDDNRLNLTQQISTNGRDTNTSI